MPYELMPRKRRPSWEPEEKKEKGVERLPIKLTDGRLLKSGEKVVLDADESEEDDDESEEEEYVPEQKVEDVSTGARFGRPAVVDVIGNKSRKARIQGAKEQIAGICQEIVADPENSVKKSIVSLSVTDSAVDWPPQTPTYFFAPRNFYAHTPGTCAK